MARLLPEDKGLRDDEEPEDISMATCESSANLRTEILDRGFDSSRVSIFRGGVLMSIGCFPEMLSQQRLSTSRDYLSREIGVV